MHAHLDKTNTTFNTRSINLRETLSVSILFEYGTDDAQLISYLGSFSCIIFHFYRSVLGKTSSVFLFSIQCKHTSVDLPKASLTDQLR
jgi:hypothetical protein